MSHNTINKPGFMSLTKTGHSSVNRMFPHINTFPNFQVDWLYAGKHLCLKAFGDLKEYDYLFTVVRDPTTRFVSSYNECVSRYGYQGSVDEFIKELKNETLSPMQLWHSQPQTKHLILHEIDRVIKLENLEHGILCLCEDLNIPTPEMAHTNKSNKSFTLSEEQKEEIKTIFKEDYERLGY